MTVEELENICNSLKGVTEDVKWKDHLCFHVGGKMFLITSPDAVPVTASFKVTKDDFDEIKSREGFMPAAYLAKYNWVMVNNINLLKVSEWEFFINKSYELVAAKLPLKIRKQLGLD